MSEDELRERIARLERLLDELAETQAAFERIFRESREIETRETRH